MALTALVQSIKEAEVEVYVMEVRVEGSLYLEKIYEAAAHLFEMPELKWLKEDNIKALETYVTEKTNPPGIRKHIGTPIYDIHTYTSKRLVSVILVNQHERIDIDFGKSQRAAFHVLANILGIFSDKAGIPEISIKLLVLPPDSPDEEYWEYIRTKDELSQVVDLLEIQSERAWEMEGN